MDKTTFQWLFIASIFVGLAVYFVVLVFLGAIIECIKMHKKEIKYNFITQVGTISIGFCVVGLIFFILFKMPYSLIWTVFGLILTFKLREKE